MKLLPHANNAAVVTDGHTGRDEKGRDGKWEEFSFIDACRYKQNFFNNRKFIVSSFLNSENLLL